ncbi:hypothetical protein OsJ_33849 [Oryza sativa Japonica Group]|uniref:Expressed protein n=2 Tax=Oryza sativa subsp. japonica TaxID=39947 RepID=Q2R4K8_ORYSJ|nr:expressed protein [Oryza sativa Japonica Group]EEE52078.1 hypothetical protein OsJ_33849 [Oryza sativa Japonica Group]BAG88454.1 unnamed protein product [Oryza sativa Japonica Group]
MRRGSDHRGHDPNCRPLPPPPPHRQPPDPATAASPPSAGRFLLRHCTANRRIRPRQVCGARIRPPRPLPRPSAASSSATVPPTAGSGRGSGHRLLHHCTTAR